VISVIICTRNRAKSLAKTLDSLKLMRDPDGVEWELIVVDNNSNDDTKRVVHDFKKSAPFPVRYAFEPRPGLSRARNSGIFLALSECSGGDAVIAFTDDDVVIHESWLSELARASHRSDCIGFAGRIVAIWNCPKPSWFEDAESYGGAIVQFDQGDEEKAVDYAVGANMAFRRCAFERHGFFRPDIGLGTNLPSGDEVEFCSRLVGAGETLMYVPQAVISHPVEQNRANKPYFRKHAWVNGRYEAAMSGFSQNSILYFRVPRFMFRNLGESFLAWLLSWRRKRRFYHELKVMRFAGQITESRRMH
jgi:glucosyl-dolichyl phosphate glucuronosyltransferase